MARTECRKPNDEVIRSAQSRYTLCRSVPLSQHKRLEMFGDAREMYGFLHQAIGSPCDLDGQFWMLTTSYIGALDADLSRDPINLCGVSFCYSCCSAPAK